MLVGEEQVPTLRRLREFFQAPGEKAQRRGGAVGTHTLVDGQGHVPVRARHVRIRKEESVVELEEHTIFGNAQAPHELQRVMLADADETRSGQGFGQCGALGRFEVRADRLTHDESSFPACESGLEHGDPLTEQIGPGGAEVTPTRDEGHVEFGERGARIDHGDGIDPVP